MTIHLPAELERYVCNEVQCGHFTSADEAITEAVRRLRQRCRLFSAYGLGCDRFWVITAADRTRTTVMLPND